MADNIQINTGTAGVYVKTKEISAGTHAGYTILADTAGSPLGTAANPLITAPSATGTQVCSIAATVPVSGAFYQSTQPVSVVATVPVSGTFYQATQPISGSVSVINTPVVTATISSIPVLSATNVTIASIATGTVSVVGTPAITGTVSTIPTGTQQTQRVANTNRVTAYVVATTSGTIVLTSGAHTIYVTDFIISVPTANNPQLASAATAIMAPIYLASNGGGVSNLVNPLVCNSAQSLTVLLSSSGTCGVTVVGYTVT
jgi:hypothetical protein